jgi:hypothetical protein
MSHDFFQDASHDLHSDPGSYEHFGANDYNYTHDMQQVLYDLNDTGDGGNFTNDVNHLIDEITAPPADSQSDQGLGMSDDHLPVFDPTAHQDSLTAGTGGTDLTGNVIPADAHDVGYDENGNWWSWGVDSETGLPTFAPDPESFAMPISLGDSSDSGS